MEIPKEQVLNMIRERGSAGQDEQAQQELPDQVDPERDAGLLQKFGVDPQQLMGMLGGGGGGGIPGL